MAEWRIGEIKQVNGEWYQCIESHSSCEGCDFKNTFKCSYAGTKCSFPVRQDHTSVIFKKLEKIENPIKSKGRVFQKLKSYYGNCSGCVFNTDKNVCDKDYFIDGPCPNIETWVEIKQDEKENEIETIHGKTCKEEVRGCDMGTIYTEIKRKEDMKEGESMTEKLKEYFAQASEEQIEKYLELLKRFNEYGVSVDEFIKLQETIQMKPFSLDAAKQGKPVCTRDGRKARIICFDKKCLDEQILIVLVDCGKEESIYFYTTDGKCIDDFSSFDLMMFPEKKEGWIVIHKEAIYDKETAEKIARETTADVIRIQKIEWEE